MLKTGHILHIDMDALCASVEVLGTLDGSWKKEWDWCNDNELLHFLAYGEHYVLSPAGSA